MPQQYILLWFPVGFHSCRIRITRMTFWQGKGKTENYLVGIANRGNYLSQHFTYKSISSSKKGRMINPTMSYKGTSMAISLLAHYLGSTTLILTFFSLKSACSLFSSAPSRQNVQSGRKDGMYLKYVQNRVVILSSQKNQFMKRWESGKVEKS